MGYGGSNPSLRTKNEQSEFFGRRAKRLSALRTVTATHFLFQWQIVFSFENGKIVLMQKDFDTWNKNKKHIQLKRANKHYHAREIWWCSLGVNVGFEHDGEGDEYQRPILIVKGLSANTCLAIPLTSSTNKHPMRVPLGKVDGREASAILSQMRVIDTKRLLGKVCYLYEDAFERTRKAIRDFI